jgi:hypothetical protein
MTIILTNDQRFLILGNHTSDNEPNYLILAEVQLHDSTQDDNVKQPRIK